jgi:hypothetical protein
MYDLVLFNRNAIEEEILNASLLKAKSPAAACRVEPFFLKIVL